MASPTSTIDQILHDIFYVGISAASIFVKNPASQQKAASLIGLLGNVVLPVADTLLVPPVLSVPVAAPVPVAA